MAFSIEEVHFLAANQEAIAHSTDELELSKKSTVADMSVLHKEFGEYARAVAELVTARRAGLRTHKFPRAEYSEHNPSAAWLVDTDSIQQATPDPGARLRAAELPRLDIATWRAVTASVRSGGAP